jgi:predicted nucleotidyltransferase
MISNNYKIYVDMDGVLSDWEAQFKRYSGGIPVDIYDSLHGKQNSFKLVNKNSPEYYANMPWMKDGKLLYNFVNSFPNVQILSHAADAKSKIGKQQWLKDKGITFEANLVPNRKDKSKFATADSILIDDREDVVNDFINAGGKAILHTNSIDTINQLKELLGIKEKYRIYNSILNPAIWATKDAIKPDVLNTLLKVANTFYKDTELTVPLEDIYFLGSTAGYNWTPTSDIDLHLVIDFAKIGDDEELVKNYVDGLKSKWNQSHDIKIGNHPVEVYIQDKSEINNSQSVYSLMKSTWVKKPKHENIKVDKDAIKKKYKQLVQSINVATQEQHINKIKKLTKRIYDMRQAGLDKSGEFSSENLAFKLLRSTGYINKLRDTVTQLTDKELSSE